jgi:hypothetical protein
MLSNACGVPRGTVPTRARVRPVPRRPARRHGLVTLVLMASVALGGCGASRVAAPGGVPGTALPPNYRVDIDSVLGTPRVVTNLEAAGVRRRGARAPFTDEMAFQIVRGFVLRHAAVFRARPGTDGFVATWADGRDGVNFVKVQQTYLGLPVDGLGYGTSVLPTGAIGSMIGRFRPGIALSTTPVLRPAEATVRAVAALAPTETRALKPAALTIAIVGDDPTPRLAWSVVVAGVGGFQSWTVTVDARDGAVLRVAQNWIEN